MATISFSGSYTYEEIQVPNVQDYNIKYNPNGTETISFNPTDPGLGYSYTINLTNANGGVHIHEGNASAQDFAGNDYYGVLTGYNQGGDFTVENTTEGTGSDQVSEVFTWLFLSAADPAGVVTLHSDASGGSFVPPSINLTAPIDLAGLSYTSTNQIVFSATPGGGTLTIVDPLHNNAVVDQLSLLGSYADGQFTLASDGVGGTALGFVAAPPLPLVVGDVERATFNITGEPYTGTIYVTDASGQLVAARYTGVSGQSYQAFETDYAAGVVSGTQYFYTGITGKPYTTETLKVDAAGELTLLAFGGVTGKPYTSYAYDYNAGQFAGSRFTYTAVPSGATYSSYETDYDFANSYLGAKFFDTNVSGQAYTGEEVDITPAGATTRVLLTGYTGQPYQTLELDYTGGAYSGYKTFATGITGQSYTGLEQDVTAAGQLTKVVYTGLKGTPYTTLEQNYTGGALSGSTFTFDAPAGQTYSSYLVTQNAAGTQISETVNNTNGSHTILGSAPNLIFESIGNDTITGGGSGETFAFHTVFGHDTLTDFYKFATGSNHDTIDLSTADFTSFGAVSASAQNVSGGVEFTGHSGSQITLLGLDKTALSGLGADFTFHA